MYLIYSSITIKIELPTCILISLNTSARLYTKHNNISILVY